MGMSCARHRVDQEASEPGNGEDDLDEDGPGYETDEQEPQERDDGYGGRS